MSFTDLTNNKNINEEFVGKIVSKSQSDMGNNKKKEEQVLWVAILTILLLYEHQVN